MTSPTVNNPVPHSQASSVQTTTETAHSRTKYDWLYNLVGEHLQTGYGADPLQSLNPPKLPTTGTNPLVQGGISDFIDSETMGELLASMANPQLFPVAGNPGSAPAPLANAANLNPPPPSKPFGFPSDQAQASRVDQVSTPPTGLGRDYSQERPFKCPEPGCPKAYKRKGHLTAHMRTHTGERPFKCDFCSKDFMNSGDRSHHLDRIHGGRRIYRCIFCDQNFTNKDDAKAHHRAHLEQKPFKCSHEGCSSAFKKKSHLECHLNTHSKECS